MRGPLRSWLAPHIEALVIEKKACGYAFEHEAGTLAVFDRFVSDSPYNDGSLSQELCMEWAKQTETEGKAHRSHRVRCVKILALYMRSIGIECYIPKIPERGHSSPPYLMSKEEVKSFFFNLDTKARPPSSPMRLSMEKSVLFRMYYCCGLRLSEGINLRRESFDLDKGVITVLQSKGDKDRDVYADPGFVELCRRYDTKMDEILPGREWFFPGQDPVEHFCGTAIEREFRKVWAKCTHSREIDKTPTVHSLRHGYVVECINKWIDEGKDVEAMMPYLSRQLGHASVDGTQYYYHACFASAMAARKLDATGDRIAAKALADANPVQAAESEEEEPPLIGRGGRKRKVVSRTKKSSDRVLQEALLYGKKS
jgi:integrase